MTAELDLVNKQVRTAAMMLAEAKNAGEAKKVADLARAAEVYAQRQKLGEECIAHATAIKVEAMALMGEFLRDAPKAPPGRPSKISSQAELISSPPTQEDLLGKGGRKVASDAQVLARAKAEKPELFEAAVAGKKAVKDVRAELAREDREAEREALAEAAAAEAPPDDDQNVVHGDFREVVAGLADESVDLIFTDPPYHREYLPLYGDMAEAAARVLKPGGSLVCYLGQYQIHEVCNLVTPHLRLWWTLCCLHTGRSARMTEYGIVVRWKPMLWFVKGTRGDKLTLVDDLVESREEKSHHDWQQSEVEAAYYVEKLCPPGGVVFDPFCGGGTTAAACKRLGRRWLTCDTDEAAVHLARKRLRDVR